jgi:3-deoxy-7-phosphoheptulonate synthase
MAAVQPILQGLSQAAGITSPLASDACLRFLADVCAGRAVAFMAGDCAETFKTGRELESYIFNHVTHLIELSLVLEYAFGLPVARFMRLSQFFKPRSSPFETINGKKRFSYYGDAVNGFEASKRKPDPTRLWTAYRQALTTHNIVNNLALHGGLSLQTLSEWSTLFNSSSPHAATYRTLVSDIQRSINFADAAGLITSSYELSVPKINLSREALVLDWEEALTRIDSRTGRRYNTTTHLVWCGARTNDPDGAHITYLAGIANPVAVKIGGHNSPDQVRRIIAKLNPDRIPGRLTLIFRMGLKDLHKLAALIQAAIDTGIPVVLLTDPMHGNTVTTAKGIKTRHFETILTEIEAFYRICRELGAHPGGIHVEGTPDNVSECLGGPGGISEEDLEEGFESYCDPRLSVVQMYGLVDEVSKWNGHMANEKVRR